MEETVMLPPILTRPFLDLLRVLGKHVNSVVKNVELFGASGLFLKEIAYMGILLLTLAFDRDFLIYMQDKVTCENMRGNFTGCIVFIRSN